MNYIEAILCNKERFIEWAISVMEKWGVYDGIDIGNDVSNITLYFRSFPQNYIFVDIYKQHVCVSGAVPMYNITEKDIEDKIKPFFTYTKRKNILDELL